MLKFLMGNSIKINGNGHNNSAESLINLTNVVKAYKTDAGDFLALKGINLTIGKGEFVGVIGKSGSGKSTLINMITGIDRPTRGEVVVGGTPVHKLNEDKMATWRGTDLGIVFQFFQLLPMLTVIENVMLPMDFCNMFSPARAPQARHAPARAGRDGRAGAQAARGALRRRAAAGGHRPRARQRPAHHPGRRADRQPGLQDGRGGLHALRGSGREGKTIIMVTHDDDLAKRVKRTCIVIATARSSRKTS